MEYSKYIIHIASELGFTPLNLVLVAMLYFLGAQHGFFPKFWKSENNTESLPATRAQMNKLSSYYNHDTTEILHSINDNIKSVHAAVGDLNKAFERLDKNVDILNETQKEWEKFGIPVRNKTML